MSQEKVNAYKASKKTRKEDLAKAKKVQLIQKIVGWVVLALVAAALVYGIVISIANGNQRAVTTSEYFVQTTLDIPDIAGIASPSAEAE
ncbi:MAG: hypothetical protein J6Z23_04115 [Lachnospiraceae bacterium]|nr:hypothetical protein [Lachnospiraceae bacterium]MBP5254551.1 hypothetical protein [Lachnospiraceae bacterium]